jgi:hypothetical protein
MIKYLNLFLFCGMIVMNYLANALPLNNVTTGQLSDSYPNLFTPAGLTFSIWGVIYLLLAACCVAQFTSGSRAIMDALGWSFAITCLLNSLWIVFWHYQMVPLSVLIMLALLFTLIYINIRIKYIPVSLIKASFGIYLGWICIATIANITALLVDLGWNGSPLSEVAWTVIMILAGTAITVAAIIQFNNPFIGLPVMWAFIGIIIKRSDDYRLIVITSVIAIIIVAVFTIRNFFVQVPSITAN